jgi:hypothetical protein
MEAASRQGLVFNFLYTNYRLDDRAGVRSPAEAKDFPVAFCVRTSSEAHPASYPLGTGGLFVGVICGQGVTLTTHPPLVMSQE